MTLAEPVDPPSHDQSTDDLAQGDSLLGVPARAFLSARAARGIGLVLVAVSILLWPSRTDRILALLIGVGLAYGAAVTSIEVVRHRDRRTFLRIASIGCGAGLAAALLTQPADSLRTSTQLVGAAAVGAAIAWTLQMVAARSASPWQVTRSLFAAIVGGLLVAFPDSLIVAATSLSATVLAAAGLINVVASERADPSERAPGIVHSAREWIGHRTSATEDRATLRDKVYFEGPNAPVRYARFATLMGFASVIASFGVAVESTAVVIGAMLIAPLMVPLMGIALSVPMGWPNRLRRCAGVAFSGMCIAIATGAIVGAAGSRGVDVTTNTEILSRISPTAADLAIAIAAGAAGAYTLARSDVSDSLPGVAVAIALVPPLTVVGLCWQQGEWSAGNGALLLFLTNAAAIIVAGGIIFVIVGAAPLQRIHEDQERLLTGVVGTCTFAAMVILLLLLNGSRLAQNELARADVDQVLVDWGDAHESFRIDDVRYGTDGALEVDVVGPDEPPELDALLDDLDEAVGDDVAVRLGWTVQQQVVRGG